jgi:hypothetical protein
VTDYRNVEAENLWELISNYAQGGHIRETRMDIRSADGEGKTPVYKFWVIGSTGKRIEHWYPAGDEVEALIKEGILEPESWQDIQRPDGAIRRYNLTDEGQRLAALSRDDVFTYLAGKNIRKHPPLPWL